MDWIDFDRWHECAELQRPGFVFEVSNAEQLSLFTECVHPLLIPPDWKSAPQRFRLVPAPPARHSDPIPAPIKPS